MLLQARTPRPCRATRGYWTGGAQISSLVTAAADGEMLPPVSPAAAGGDNQQSCFIRELINPCRSSLVTMIKFAEAEELPPSAALLPVGMAGMALLHRRSRHCRAREALAQNRTRPLHLHVLSPIVPLLAPVHLLIASPSPEIPVWHTGPSWGTGNVAPRAPPPAVTWNQLLGARRDAMLVIAPLPPKPASRTILLAFLIPAFPTPKGDPGLIPSLGTAPGTNAARFPTIPL